METNNNGVLYNYYGCVVYGDGREGRRWEGGSERDMSGRELTTERIDVELWRGLRMHTPCKPPSQNVVVGEQSRLLHRYTVTLNSLRGLN